MQKEKMYTQPFFSSPSCSLPFHLMLNQIQDQTNVYLEGGSGENPVTWSCKGVECEGCFIWYHADCQNINSSMNDRLGKAPVILVSLNALLVKTEISLHLHYKFF
ncbi:hypothetical protein MAR_011106 [Mya arenaria]|uniref:Uncharacterized protein n=1 Tax=Mya arenaria TaxID=6604 RepID=A0ABY7FTB3_MYAAR|nr:hypothetical protein MAR_011106 [Mya arenaria]